MASAIGGWSWEAPAENRGPPSALFGERSRPSEAGASLWELLQGPGRRLASGGSGSTALSAATGAAGGAAAATPSGATSWGATAGRGGGGGEDADFLGSLVRQKQQKMMEHMPPSDSRDRDGRGSAPRRYGERFFGAPSSASPPRGRGFDPRQQQEQPPAPARQPMMQQQHPWDVDNGSSIKRQPDLQGFDGASSSGPPREQSPFDTHRGEENLDFEFERAGGASNVEGTLRRNFAKCDPRNEGLVEARELFERLRQDPEGQLLLGLTCLPGEEEPSWLRQQQRGRLTWPDVLDLFLQRGLSALTASSAAGSHRGDGSQKPTEEPAPAPAASGALTIPRALEDIVSRSRTRGLASLETQAVASLAAKAGTAAATNDAPKVTSGQLQLTDAAASQPVAGRSAAPVAVVGGTSNLPSVSTRARTLSPTARPVASSGVLGTSRLASAGLASSSNLVSGLAAVSTERPISREEMLSSGRLLPPGEGLNGGGRAVTPTPGPLHQAQPPLPPPHTVSLGGQMLFPGAVTLPQAYPMMPLSMPWMVPNSSAGGYYPQAIRPAMAPYPGQAPVSAPTLLRQGLAGQSPEGVAFVNNFRSLVEQSEDVLRKLGEHGQESAQFRALLKESEEVLAELEGQARPARGKVASKAASKPSKAKVEHPHDDHKSKHNSVCSNDPNHSADPCRSDQEQASSRARSHSQRHSSGHHNHSSQSQSHGHGHGHSQGTQHISMAPPSRPLPPASALLRPVPVPTHLPYAPVPFPSGYHPQVMASYGAPPMSMGSMGAPMMMMHYPPTAGGIQPMSAPGHGPLEAIAAPAWQASGGSTSASAALDAGSAQTPPPGPGPQVPQTSQHIAAPQVDMNDPDTLYI